MPTAADHADPGPPPEPSWAHARWLSAAVLGLWLALTLGSHLLAPRLVRLVDSFEVAFGYDILPGWDDVNEKSP